eukprot:CAMPEP_0185019466 /NCGR_PEP_ID=MMETSP1103-20130426/2075_1 /TAXON_ID=36769 /ORGANISM="Paraphysomonas bandaiensis, Strain Caron Lab Isolate" /LENGTH=440 /DNA_ID=CAMNT_0027549793 /DNA_START=371 /DNA_END=1693 /DNA_ORIENTATION=+
MQMDVLHWVGCLYRSIDSLLASQEGHAICMLDDFFLVSVEGWGSNSENLEIIDTTTLPYITKINCISEIPDSMSFTYGFSLSRINDRCLLKYGGCSEGGYRRAVNDMCVISISLCDENDKLVTGARYTKPVAGKATYRPITVERNEQSTEMLPWPRGYHTATCISLNNAPTMLVFGGLGPPTTPQLLEFIGDNEGVEPDPAFLQHMQQTLTRPLTRLECLDTTTMQWRRVHASGTEPCPRFGHSCSYHPSTDRLIFISGSDGSDLLRNGTELNDIHILSIIRGEFGNDSLVWSTPKLFPRSPCESARDLLPGRCHCACLAGNKIITFGGSAEISNAVTVIDISSANDIFLLSPEVKGHSEPAPRISSTGALVGKYFLVYGGYNSTERELGDAWLLDLSYSTASYRGEEHEAETTQQENEFGYYKLYEEAFKDLRNECIIT